MSQLPDLKEFLDRKVKEYNRPAFIPSDPIVVPHLFSKKQDIEISAFFAAIFSWGNRTTIINKCKELMKLMGDSPYAFIVNHRPKELKSLEGFCHRTFNATDLLYFISFLKHHYKEYDSLEDAFVIARPGLIGINRKADISISENRIAKAKKRLPEPVELYLNYFYTNFFSLKHIPERTRKHIAAPMKNSACKRLNMFLRWMVRNDNKGVDFGIWKKIKPSELICPLDVHVARVAKRFQLLDRPNPDWIGALDLTHHLRAFDPEDPAKYDFALFALGAIERF